MKNLSDYDFLGISEKDAAELGPFGADDGPVAVTCYRERVEFRSRKAARGFYETAMLCTSGSESARYAHVVADIDAGRAEATDGARRPAPSAS